MKHLSLFTLLLFICLLSNGQSLRKFKLVSETSQRPIFNALISEHSTTGTTRSDIDGNFEVLDGSVFTIKYDGYNSMTIDTKIYKSSIIILRPEIESLDEIIINSYNIPLKQKLSTQSVSYISKTDLELSKSHDMSDVLNKVTGVFMQSGTLNTNRITIRGIGASNLFGTANIRAYFGDIPLTDGNGESSIEDMELNTLSNISILKGPSASTYGVGLGGTILLQPKLGFNESEQINMTYTYGSFGFQKYVASSNINLKNIGLNFVYSITDSDGYRNNNQYNRQTITGTAKIYLTENDDLTFLGSIIDLKGGIPSSLSRSDFEENPSKAAFTWGQSKAFEDLKYGILGLSWNHLYNEKLSHVTSLNTSIRQNYEPRPFNILNEESNSFGIRSRLLGKIKFRELVANYTLGGELFYDFYNNKTYQNLYQDFEDDRGSVQGNQLTGFKERRNYFNVFFDSNLEISENLTVNVGANLNKTYFLVEDKFQRSRINNNGKFHFKTLVSPKIGYNYRFNSNLYSFGNISHGFSTPTTAETLLPDGQFNPDLRPEIGWNFETGLRFYLLENKLLGSFSVYKMLISDLLVSRRTQEDDFFAINAGSSIHNGLEADLNYTLFRNENYSLQTDFGFSIHDYRFDKFIDLDDNYSGNRIAGVPTSVLNFQIKLTSKTGFYGNLGFQSVGKMAANDSNFVNSDSYNLFNSKIGYRNSIFKDFRYNIFASVYNLFNEKYASQLQINAIGFGNNEPRYFYPGLPANYYFGTRLSYNIR